MVKYLYGGNLLFRLDLSLGLISICLLACFIFSFLHGTWAVIDFDYESDADRYECGLTQERHDICLSVFIAWEWDVRDAFVRLYVSEGVRGEWLIVIFSVRGDRLNLICGMHHCLQSTANKADSYPPEEHACLCGRERLLFVCSALWLTRMIGFCCSVWITIQHTPNSTTNSLPSGHPNALNHKNRKGLSCKNGVDSIPSGKLKGRDAFLFLSHL